MLKTPMFKTTSSRLKQARKSMSKRISSRSHIDTQKIKVGVAFPGRREEIEIGLTSTILELKQKYEAVVGISVEQQNMMFNGKKLKNKRSVRSYKIQDERTITLVGGEFSKYIVTPPSDPTLQRLKEHIARGHISMSHTKKENLDDKQDDAADVMLDITLDFTLRFENKLVELTCPKQHSVSQLRDQIQKTMKLADMDKFILVHPGTETSDRSSLLSDLDAEVNSLNIDGSTLELRSLVVTFRVSLPNGTVETVELDYEANVSELVDKLLAMNLDDPASLVLLNEGEEVPLDGSLLDCGIRTGSFLDLKRMSEHGNTISVVVQWGDKSLDLMVDPDEEMWDVMRKIEEAGAGNAQRMTLMNADDEELDDEGTLRDWAVDDGDVLRVVIA